METKNEHTKYDIIGDIHGHADTLRALLVRLGYAERDGAYRHPERRAVFVGDYIDRGPKIRETLQIVRTMVDAGTALAIVGNHEYNAIRYHTFVEGRPLRPHTEKNAKQHRATLDQLALPHPQEWAGWIAWFQTLPLFLDLGGVRVVHAAWCDKSIRFLGTRRLNDMALLVASSQPGEAEYDAVGTVLSGPELNLPDGHSFTDKDSHVRKTIRARWFGPRPVGQPATYRGFVFPPSDEVPETEVTAEALASLPCYGDHEPPVVFGHYWMPPIAARCLARNAACVDYSVASPQGGWLTAYRWNGETELNDASLVAEPRTVLQNSP